MRFLTEAYWCAGFWDGEGCTSYMKQYRDGRRREYLYPVLTISQTDREVLDRFMAVIGLGTIYPMPGNGSTKPYHVWRAGGWKAAILFENIFYDKLSRLKRDQLDTVLADCRAFKEAKNASPSL